MMKIGFIGGGMMGEALIKGFLTHGHDAINIFVSDKSKERVNYLKDNYAVNAFVGADGFLGKVDVVVLAVKPQVAPAVMKSIVGGLRPDTLVVSIVAGLHLKALEDVFKTQPVVRVMPNTPLSIGEGMSAYALGTNAQTEHGFIVDKLLATVGRVAAVSEAELDAVTGLSGSGPAYGFLVIDALADGGVAAGLPRAMAIEMAAQTILGAAKMVLESGQHPDVLRDAVTSPAGTTIAGVRALEDRGVRGAFIDAVLKAADRSRELGADK